LKSYIFPILFLPPIPEFSYVLIIAPAFCTTLTSGYGVLAAIYPATVPYPSIKLAAKNNRWEIKYLSVKLRTNIKIRNEINVMSHYHFKAYGETSDEDSNTNQTSNCINPEDIETLSHSSVSSSSRCSSSQLSDSPNHGDKVNKPNQDCSYTATSTCSDDDSCFSTFTNSCSSNDHSEDELSLTSTNPTSLQAKMRVHTSPCFPLDIDQFYIEAATGNLENMKWLNENGVPFDKWVFYFSALQGTLDNMEWLLVKNCPFDENTFRGAAENGNIENLKFLLDVGCPWNATTFSAAARYGCLDNLKWLRRNRCPWNTDTFKAAAEKGILCNLQWLKDNRCPWDTNTFTAAALQGSLENMKWLRSNGCPWNEETFEAAARSGNLRNMKWLKRSGCPWSKQTFHIFFNRLDIG